MVLVWVFLVVFIGFLVFLFGFSGLFGWFLIKCLSLGFVFFFCLFCEKKDGDLNLYR